MIDAIVNLVFGCWHRRLSRPMAEPSQPGGRPSDGFVVCLDCGRRFAYDLREMKLGKRLADPPPFAPALPEDSGRRHHRARARQ